MKPFAFAQAALLSACVAGSAQAVNYVSNGSFETSGASLVDTSYCYLNVAGHECGGVSGWNGVFPLILGSSGPWGAPNTPYGNFLAGLQNQSHFEQALSLPSAGVYALSWADAGRGNFGSGAQAYQVLFDGVALNTQSVAMGAGWSMHTLSFNAGSGGMLRFQGLNTVGDSTAFIDNISVQAPVPEPTRYSMLAIGLGLLVFTARSRDTEKFTA
ncbi:hypothetical protein AAKU55_003018 [Oxalobacteraceae bacterium GrIS 1.11]